MPGKRLHLREKMAQNFPFACKNPCKMSYNAVFVETKSKYKPFFTFRYVMWSDVEVMCTNGQ